MKKLLFVALGLLCLSCGDESIVAPPTSPTLEVLVSWDGQGLADRRLVIVELSLEKTTNAAGRATFTLPAGTYTLRAYVTVPGPAGFRDQTVTVREGQTTRAYVTDCLPCVSPS